MMLRNVNICSQPDRPFLKPACCSRSLASTESWRRSSSTILSTFPGTDSSVTPLQLLQSAKFPFLSSFTMTPFLHFFWYLSVAVFPTTVELSCHLLRHCFNKSAVIWSYPAALLFLGFLIALSTSSSVMLSIFTSNCCMTTSSLKFQSVVGLGWFRTS